jgi:sugar lactone lactonase YvrE
VLLVVLVPSTSAAPTQPIVALAPIEIVLDGQRELAGVAVAGNGTAYVSDVKAGKVLRLAPSGVLTIAVGGLDHPRGLAIDAAGRVIVAEERAERVVRLESNGSLTVLASGVRRPRWVAVTADGTLYIAAHRLLGPDGSDPDEAKVIIRRDAVSGALSVVATDVRKLEALAVDGNALYAAARRAEALPNADGVIVRFLLLANGALGVPAYFVASGFE